MDTKDHLALHFVEPVLVKHPHKCPVCEGHGIVPGGFYDSPPGIQSVTSGVATETCRACRGEGIVWSAG